MKHFLFTRWKTYISLVKNKLYFIIIWGEVGAFVCRILVKNNFTSSNLCKLRPPEMKMSIYCFSKIVWDQFSLFWSEIFFSSPHSRPSCQVWEWLSWPPTKNHSPFIHWSFFGNFWYLHMHDWYLVKILKLYVFQENWSKKVGRVLCVLNAIWMYLGSWHLGYKWRGVWLHWKITQYDDINNQIFACRYFSSPNPTLSVFLHMWMNVYFVNFLCLQLKT